MHQRFHVVSGLFVLLMTSVGASCATTGDTSSSSQEIAGTADAGVTTTNGGGHHPGHGPPQVAIDACAALADGATCSVTFTDPSGASHTLNGTCTTGPDGTGVEACAPDHPPGPPPGGGAGSDGGCAGDPGGPGGDQGDPGGGPPPTPRLGRARRWACASRSIPRQRQQRWRRPRLERLQSRPDSERLRP